MRILILFLFYSLSISCHKSEDNPSGTLKLNFNGHFGTLPFNALQSYAYTGNQSIKFSKVDFYITGIQLVSSTETIQLNQHALIDLTSSSNNTFPLTLTGIKQGEYQSIIISIGVTSDLNKKLPKDFNSADPLSSTSHYWDTWNSFIFSKMEGVLDTSGTKTYDLGFAVHTGTDQCLQSLNIQKQFSISDNAETSLNLDVDIKSVFTASGQFYDLVKSPLNHNPTNIETLKAFSERLATSIQLKN